MIVWWISFKKKLKGITGIAYDNALPQLIYLCAPNVWSLAHCTRSLVPMRARRGRDSHGLPGQQRAGPMDSPAHTEGGRDTSLIRHSQHFL